VTAADHEVGYRGLLAFLSDGLLNVTPSFSPFTQASSQRRNANPVGRQQQKEFLER
jgi:hypothetical protein